MFASLRYKLNEGLCVEVSWSLWYKREGGNLFVISHAILLPLSHPVCLSVCLSVEVEEGRKEGRKEENPYVKIIRNRLVIAAIFLRNAGKISKNMKIYLNFRLIYQRYYFLHISSVFFTFPILLSVFYSSAFCVIVIDGVASYVCMYLSSFSFHLQKTSIHFLITLPDIILFSRLSKIY